MPATRFTLSLPLLTPLLAVSACTSSVHPEPKVDPLAVVHAVGAAPLRVDSIWPGYVVRDQGFLLYEPGGSAILVTLDGPPPGFSPVADSLLPPRLRGRAFAHPGDLPGLEGGFDTEYRIGDVVTTAYPVGSSLAGTLEGLYHEAFHAYQRRRFTSPAIRERSVDRDLITAEFVAMAEVERRILKEAIDAESRTQLDTLIRSFLAVRDLRLQDLPPQVERVERESERREGSANLVGLQLTAATLDRDPGRVAAAVTAFLDTDLDVFGGDRLTQIMQWRAYGTGAAMGLLLDRMGVAWRARLETGAPFDSLLRITLGPGPRPSTALARTALGDYGYRDILNDVDVAPSADEELETFYGLEPVRLVIEAMPRDTASYDAKMSFRVSNSGWDRLLGRRRGVSQPVPGLTLIPKVELLHILDPGAAGFSLRVENRPVAIDGRGGKARRRLIVLLPEVPTVQGANGADGANVERGPHRYARGVVIAGDGVRFETELATNVALPEPDSVHVSLSP